MEASIKKAELARGAELAASFHGAYFLVFKVELVGIKIKQINLNTFIIKYEGENTAVITWRLDDNGMGHVKVKPTSAWSDIIKSRCFDYNYIDGVPDFMDFMVFIEPTINEITA